ncbi:hypothetical protein LEP1GSC193_1343 [Leptospira alstonii serovar Pingchang str. 80-412]|uniref:Uncharacterized protein n=2 Tax=Leptospira alstonii TaxID=28452 RepID=M6CG24_9LEPT|nr:hypothetical protein LEP1GSC194_1098 [Leptospira alstonii serovar Sichuan str. 79601]EQA81838.1 hypothetical protein LEP1GSC193_1343 [Leptospira alstonii serovar Pingchang str. 80-412]
MQTDSALRKNLQSYILFFEFDFSRFFKENKIKNIVLISF